jgi:hypothetical protein
MSRPLGPATPVFRGNAGNPYDVRALIRNFGGSWGLLRLRMPFPMPEQGHRHLMNLSHAQTGALLRNWRNAR